MIYQRKTFPFDQMSPCYIDLFIYDVYSCYLQLCQLCRRDDNEAQLLLCDGCDRGYHTYCFKVSLHTPAACRVSWYSSDVRRASIHFIAFLVDQSLARFTWHFNIFFSQRWRIFQMEIGIVMNAYQRCVDLLLNLLYKFILLLKSY